MYGREIQQVFIPGSVICVQFDFIRGCVERSPLLNAYRDEKYADTPVIRLPDDFLDVAGGESGPGVLVVLRQGIRLVEGRLRLGEDLMERCARIRP